jgi:hypothetical protein
MQIRPDKSSPVAQLESPVRLEGYDSCGPSLLAAIPIFVIGLFSAMGPRLLTPPRLLATLATLGAAGALVMHGWPRRRSVVVYRTGRISTGNGRLLLSQTSRLSLTASRPPGAESSDYRFQLWASDSPGKRCLIFSASDPGPVATRARQMSEFLAAPVDVGLESFVGTLAGDSTQAQIDAAEVHDLLERLPRFSRYVVWLAWGGCLFVWALSASLLRAHLLRSGSVSLASLLLFALLCGVGLLLPHWALGTRLGTRIEQSQSTPTGSPTPAGDVTLYTHGLFGARRLARWGRLAQACCLLSPGIGGHWYLVVMSEHKTQALRLAVPPNSGHVLAPTQFLR